MLWRGARQAANSAAEAIIFMVAALLSWLAACSAAGLIDGVDVSGVAGVVPGVGVGVGATTGVGAGGM